jgi:hypothetical protein
MSGKGPFGDETPGGILATLRESGWTEKDLEADPYLSDLLDGERRANGS